MVLKWTSVLVVGALLWGCSSQRRADAPGDEALKPPSVLESACDAAGARFALGQPVSPRLVEDARVRSRSLYVRILKVGDSVPLEQSTQRLNLLLDPKGEVQAVRCR